MIRKLTNEQIWKEAEKDIVIDSDGGMNVVESCVDRHAEKNPEKLAFIFEYDNGVEKKYTYKELQEEVNRYADYLKNNLKIKENSRVFIFLPKVPETYISFLAAIKAGCIAAPLFEAFQTEGLEMRLHRGDADVLITNTELIERLPKKDIEKGELKKMKLIVVDSPEFQKELKKCSVNFKSVLKKKMDTMIMMFTSSTAGTPVAGVEIPNYALVQQHMTAKLVLDLKDNDRYWCTAHPGWVTGTVYGILAPLSIGCTNYVISGRFDSHSWLEFIKKNKISVIYTAPTALRMLQPDLKKEHFPSVRNVCSVGEALNKVTFDFYKNTVGIEIRDTYWQTETGAMVIANQNGDKKKPGSIGRAIPGIEADVKDGSICLKKGWPAMMTGIYKHEKMYSEYFKGEWFYTNDLAKKDDEGYFFFISRKDDMIKTSGERVSPIEVETELMRHKAVKEAAVIGIPHDVKGQIIKAFIVLNKSFSPSEELKNEITEYVKKDYAGHAYPKEMEFVEKLPKTNSGKIIRMKLKEMELEKLKKN